MFSNNKKFYFHLNLDTSFATFSFTRGKMTHADMSQTSGTILGVNSIFLTHFGQLAPQQIKTTSNFHL